jgi:cytochrome P450
MMLKSDAGLSLDEMVSNVFIFFLAGHETTASALSWLLYHLSTHPEIQQKVRDEVERVLNGRPLTSELMRELPYTSHVIKENMRIQPPVTELATRECVQDTEFEGVVIPKGIRIGIGIETAHLNEEFWDKPHEFIPERFENNTKQHPFAYMPFSLKSRACIGSQFSLLEQTMFLTTIVQYFKWTFVELNPATKSIVLNRPDLLRVKFEQIRQF